MRVDTLGIFLRLRGEAALALPTNRIPPFYELTPANVAEVNLVEELLAEARL